MPTPSTLGCLLLGEDLNAFQSQLAQSGTAGLLMLDDFPSHARVPIAMQVGRDAAGRFTLVRRLFSQGGDVVGHGDEMFGMHT
jgi:hypothetical protein